ncbi:DUF4397 domain-containing protein [Rudanella paleaurantiibacter]|uniref:DUF4397 domain-containing protein n=1 Tax=Rudanella paleaurantiibacter TaxID=2614655 RepID=A0A7J5TTS1_9BACT|nr:DUF4397 domain-containing protein [Rudanella paleaurantiibacter]KAB7726865.1 DUF4397 domain-containing protein [Rudanella paleaurantiibacter]
MKATFLYLAFISSALLGTLAGCMPEEPTSQPLGEEKDKAKIIFVNATPNSATQPAAAQREIAIWPFYNGVQFNNFPIKFPWSNGYKAFTPGSMTMRFDTARSQANDPSGPAAKVGELTFPTQADTYYSVYSIGTAQRSEFVVLTDNLALPAPSKAKVRVMNYSPDAPPLDLVITAGSPSGPVVLATNLAYKGVKDFFEIDPGIYTVEFRLAGTNTVVRSKSNVIIDRNSCYSIWARGFRTLPSPGNTFSGYAFDISYHANRWSNPL